MPIGFENAWAVARSGPALQQANLQDKTDWQFGRGLKLLRQPFVIRIASSLSRPERSRLRKNIAKNIKSPKREVCSRQTPDTGSSDDGLARVSSGMPPLPDLR